MDEVEVAAATQPVVARRRRGTVDGGWGEEGEEINYVQLAKAGGRKDLLQHYEYSREAGAEPVVYPRVDWFEHRPPSPVSPAQLPAINAHDNSLLSWPVEEVERKRPHRRTRLPALWQKVPLQPSLPNRQRSRTKLPPPPASITKLLSWDYQKEWLSSNKERLKQRRKQQQEKRQQQQQKLQEHTMKVRKMAAGVDQEGHEQKRFIMKRFANVPPKLKLPAVHGSGGEDDH